MQTRSFLAAVLLFLISVPALATPQPINGSDMWFDPAESGWGLNIFHQGDTLFAALFVYGPDSQPKWYVASSLAGGPTTYSGALYEATGPAFSGPFNPSNVMVRQVGTMTVALGSDVSNLDYTVDSVHVTKQVRPFTFRRTNLTGSYYGYQYQPEAGGTPEIRRDQNITIQDDGTDIAMETQSDSEIGCSYSGTRGQNGQIETVSGTYFCGPMASPVRSGSWLMSVDPTPDGFTGSFTGNGITNPSGRIAASTRGSTQLNGNGWRTDNWCVPSESGWGVNIVEQGDTIFATIFVYDAQGKSHWYVASALAQSGSGLGAIYSGPLNETTGHYFGNAFDPASVTTRQVGTMGFQLVDQSTATLIYTVDGISVTKRVSRFAFRNNDLSGSYIGHTAATNADAPASLTRNPITITINDGGGSFLMTTDRAPTGSAPTGSCTFTGPPATQFGAQKFVGGTFSCTGGQSGTFTMENLFVTSDGFTGTFEGLGVVGHIEGVRLGTN
jgi:hypothetical protein